MSGTPAPDDAMPAAEDGFNRGLANLAWLPLFAGLVIWVAYRLDLFDVWTWVTAPDGTRVRLPDTFATVDHPFHAARAETLRQSLAGGEWLRWIGHHQGGYPVEFYPLGVAWLETALWAVFLGALPMAFIHKAAVALIFLLPMLGFALLARRDRLSPGVAFAATAAHVCVNGWWWSGGYHELVNWGLITNVAGHIFPLFTLVALVSFLKEGSRRNAAVAGASAAIAIYCNPRSFLPLAVVAVAALVAVAIETTPEWSRIRLLTTRLVLVGVAGALLAAPELLALVRFNDLYYFVHYERYADATAFIDSSIQAVSGPIFVASVAGLVLGLAIPGRVHTRAAAITLLIYGSLTALMATGSILAGTVEQLELTRLMPFQRLLMLYLAAVAVSDALTWIGRRMAPVGRLVVDGGLVSVAALVALLYVIAPPSFISEGDRGLYEIPTAADPAIADLAAAVRTADQEAAPGTALLILGSSVSWHDQLWGPLWSVRPLFYDDWLWYWQTEHFGDYNPLIEHAYPNDASTLDSAYLSRHGVGSVVVTGVAKSTAAMSSLLRQVRAGLYDVYVVRNPTTIVTFGGENASESDIDGQHVEAEGVGPDGSALIRRNWFPRWRATVNDEPATITATDDGYMTLPVPDEAARIELQYVVNGWDWLGRAAAALGIAVLVALSLPDRLVVKPMARWVRR